MDTYIVEFWPLDPHGEWPTPEPAPHVVTCSSAAEADKLETDFHTVGWTARAFTIHTVRKPR